MSWGNTGREETVKWGGIVGNMALIAFATAFWTSRSITRWICSSKPKLEAVAAEVAIRPGEGSGWTSDGVGVWPAVGVLWGAAAGAETELTGGGLIAWRGEAGEWKGASVLDDNSSEVLAGIGENKISLSS